MSLSGSEDIAVVEVCLPAAAAARRLSRVHALDTTTIVGIAGTFIFDVFRGNCTSHHRWHRPKISRAKFYFRLAAGWAVARIEVADVRANDFGPVMGRFRRRAGARRGAAVAAEIDRHLPRPRAQQTAR